MHEFTEVADRVWVTRLEWCDVNVAVVAGSDGLAVVDTYVSTERARALLQDVRRLGGPVRWAVNTHVHYDHTFGNRALVEAGAALVAHENAAAALPAHVEEVKEQARAQMVEDPRLRELVDSEVDVPGRTFSSVTTLDLGDRALELVHPGRGHTDGDLVVRVPEADVLLVGDLVEEADGGVPGLGSDAFPLEWPLALDTVLSLATSSTTVVPGHGAVVDRAFVEEQRNRLGLVAETIRDLAGRGVAVEDALDAAAWPWPAERLATAVRRGYEQLPRNQRRLPLA